MAPRCTLRTLSLVAVLLVAGCGGGGGERARGLRGGRRRRLDHAAAVRRADRAGQEDLQGGQARVPEGRHGRAGSRLDQQAISYLVQRVQLAQAAADRDIEVTDADVEKQLDQIKKQSFGGDQERYEEQLKKQGLTDAQVRDRHQGQPDLGEAVRSVTKDLKVTDADVKKYYEDNKAQYGTPESRDVRHILVKTRAQADKLYDQLEGGRRLRHAREEVLASTRARRTRAASTPIVKGRRSRRSSRPRSCSRRATVSRPVKTQYGCHIIQPLGDDQAGEDAAARQDADDADPRAAPQAKKDAAMNDLGRGLEKSYEDKVDYAAGFAPPPTSSGVHRLRSSASALADALVELQELTRAPAPRVPWDREQTARTIVPHTVEEAYEVADAALAGDDAKLLDELGDLLFQSYFLALLLEEKGAGDLEQVARAIHEKLVRRHPHVFGDAGRGRRRA